MDPVSQAVLGGAIGALFRPALGRKAVAFGAVCGALPDLDIVAGWAGEWALLVHHRGATHSLLVLTLVAPLLGWVGYRWGGRSRYWSWTHLAWWALITHPLLDWCTAYGTQLWWPLSHARLANDAVAVIDPGFTLPLLVAVLLNLWPRFSARAARWTAVAALVLSLAHLTTGYFLARRAVALARPQLAASGFEPVALRGTPTLLNLWVRRVVARDGGGNLAVGYVSMLSPQPIAFEFLPRPSDPLARRALASDRGRLFQWFADGMVGVEVNRTPDGATVILSDQRYGLITRLTASPFRAQATFDRTGRLVALHRLGRDLAGTTLGRELRALWRLF